MESIFYETSDFDHLDLLTNLCAIGTSDIGENWIGASSKSGRFFGRPGIYIRWLRAIQEKLNSFEQIALAAHVQYVELFQFVPELLFKPFDMMEESHHMYYIQQTVL